MVQLDEYGPHLRVHLLYGTWAPCTAVSHEAEYSQYEQQMRAAGLVGSPSRNCPVASGLLPRARPRRVSVAMATEPIAPAGPGGQSGRPPDLDRPG